MSLTDASADPVTSISEPVAVTAAFCHGLHTVEVDSDGIAHLTLYARQREADGGAMERIVVARLLLPRAALPDIAARMLAADRTPMPDPYAERQQDMN